MRRVVRAWRICYLCLEGNRKNLYKEIVNPFHKTTIGKPKKWLIDAVAEIGIDITGLSHETTNHFKNHVKKRHGQGALSISDKDLEKIPAIVKSPDLAIVGTIRDGAIINVYVKMEPRETFLYFDEVLYSNRNKTLRSRTFFIFSKPLDMENLERIVTMNGITDLSRAKKIIAAGGHPGGVA
jgi:hypothetical protein